MSGTGHDRPTALYRAHRAVLTSVMIATGLTAAVLIVIAAPAIGGWVAGAINSLHAAWISLHWKVL